MEKWREIVGFEDAYEVSDMGRVRALVGGQRWGRILKPDYSRKNYPCVVLYLDGVRAKRAVAGLVLAAFVGPKPAGMEICHNDGNQKHNWPSNLRYDSRAGNFADKVRHGTDARGEKHPKAKLTTKDVATIRMSRGRISQQALADRYGVTQSHISDIQLHRSWRYTNP